VPLEPVDVRLDTVDFAGNAASVTVPVRFDAEVPAPEIPPDTALGTGRISLDCVGDWLVVSAHFTRAETEAPTLTIECAHSHDRASFHRIDEKRFRAGYQPEYSSERVVLRVEHPRITPYARRIAVQRRGSSPTTATLDDVRVTMGSNAAYGTLFVWLDTPGRLPPCPIRALGPGWRLNPDAMPIDENVRIDFPVPEGYEQIERVHIYRAMSWGWSCETTERGDGRLTITTRHFGDFMAMEDTVPPKITQVRIGYRERGITRRAPISAHVKDVGSGLADITVTCGDQWLLMEYDPEHNRLEWVRDEDLPTGELAVVFRVTDRAGNTSEFSRTITVPAGD
jgi:hypothetical protein